MSTNDYVLKMYRKDARYTGGERLARVEEYVNVTEEWITRFADQVRLQVGVARVEVAPKYTTVKNLITGRDVNIRTELRGTCVDPSQERFWSM